MYTCTDRLSRSQQKVPAAHSTPWIARVPSHTPSTQDTSGAGPMEICQPDPPIALPLLMPPSVSGSSTASSSPSSSLVHTPPEGDALMVDVTGLGPAVYDPTAPRGPAQYTSVVEGRDDEAKEAAYAMLGLSKAPAPPQMAQPAPASEQPPAAEPLEEDIPMSSIPEIVISPPGREIPTVEAITTLLAQLTLEPVAAAEDDEMIDLDLLYAAPWVITPRPGTSQEEDSNDEAKDVKTIDEKNPTYVAPWVLARRLGTGQKIEVDDDDDEAMVLLGCELFDRMCAERRAEEMKT